MSWGWTLNKHDLAKNLEKKIKTPWPSPSACFGKNAEINWNCAKTHWKKSKLLVGLISSVEPRWLNFVKLYCWLVYIMWRQILKNFQGMGISHMVSVTRIFHYGTFHKMNLARLIPILAVVTCQLHDYDPFTECPWVKTRYDFTRLLKQRFK